MAKETSREFKRRHKGPRNDFRSSALHLLRVSAHPTKNECRNVVHICPGQLLVRLTAAAFVLRDIGRGRETYDSEFSPVLDIEAVKKVHLPSHSTIIRSLFGSLPVNSFKDVVSRARSTWDPTSGLVCSVYCSPHPQNLPTSPLTAELTA